MSTFVVIDTETTWTDDVMSIGAVIADGTDFSIIDSRYYLIDPAFRYPTLCEGRDDLAEIAHKYAATPDHIRIVFAFDS